MKAKKKITNRRKYEAQVLPRSSERPEAELMYRERQALLDQELHKLPEKYRAPFLCSAVWKGSGDSLQTPARVITASCPATVRPAGRAPARPCAGRQQCVVRRPRTGG